MRKLLWGVLLVASLAAAQDRPAKKLIEYGWDVPYPDYLRAHIKDMEKKPFDGLLFRLKEYNSGFDPRPWPAAALQAQRDDLAKIEWGSFTDNFLTLYSANNFKMSWFNDQQWETIAANLKLYAEAARAGHCVGICFDPEPYGDNPWELRTMGEGRPYAEAAAAARKRGRQFMTALQAGLPNCKLLTFFHFTLFAHLFDLNDAKLRETQLASHPYALYVPFLNGMYDVAAPGVTFIDGNENSYYYTSAEDYLRAYHSIRQKAQTLVAPENRAKYNAQTQAGASVYADQVMALRESKVLSYHMDPADRPKFAEHNTYWALASSDEYVWLYSEKMNWWTGPIPAGFEDAVRSARAKVAAGKMLGIDLKAVVAKAEKNRESAIGARLFKREATIARRGKLAAPVIDGQLNDDLWAGLKPLEPLLPVAESAVTKPQPTTVRVAYDDQYLYVGARLGDATPDKISAIGTKKDDPVWEGDSFELFVSLGAQPTPYRHFMVNPKGVLWDGASSDAGDDVSWNGEWQGAATIGKDAWKAELRIPWSLLGGPPKPGSVRRANLCRARRQGGELSVWSGTVRGFIEPERFGVWRLP